MTERTDVDEERILDALGALEGDPQEAFEAAEEADGSPSDEATTLRRLYVETLGLLAYANEPAEPSPLAKRRLMAAIAAGGDAPRAAAGPGPSSGAVETARGGRHGHEPGGWSAPHWLAALAAAFALAVIGLAGWLYLELDRTRDALAALQQERTVLAADLESRQAGYLSERGRLVEAVALMSTRGVEICPLHPVGEAPLQPRAFAVLYMVPGKGEWYLQATNLAAPPAGEVYRVWFLTPRGPVAGGVLEPGPKADLQIAPGALDEKEVLSVTVTLEGSGNVRAPTGPPVLYGDEKMQVI